MTVSVARLSCLNAEPFYRDMERRGFQLRDMLPSQVAPALQEGIIDAAPVPLADAFSLGDGFQPVSGFCISTVDESLSVLLYSRLPVDQLTGVTVGVCDEPGSSLQLLQVLLQEKHRVQPQRFTAMDDSSDAFLVTDDQALRRRRGVRGYPHRYDLGEEWRQWTGLPFVYSRWYVRKGLDPTDSLLLEDALYVGMEDGVQALFDESEPRDDVLMLPKDVSEYIRGFRFFMGLSEYKSVDLFRQYLEQIEPESR